MRNHTRKCLLKVLRLLLLSVAVLTVIFKSSSTFNREAPNQNKKKKKVNEDDITVVSKIPECLPHPHFAYVKTHKTGSTTVYNVLHKYAQKHHLNMALKSPNPFLGGYPGHIREEFVYMRGVNNTLRPVEAGEKFVLIDHYRFNHTVLKKIMPRETLFISIVRKPWKQFQSSFYYYYSNPQALYLRRATCFYYPFFHVAEGRRVNFDDYVHLATERLSETTPWFFRSKNYQSHDLGIDPLLEDDDKIKTVIQQLGSQIDLMMITDYMDESMILLKDLLCMSWSDILFVDLGTTHLYDPHKFDEDFTIMKKFRKLYKLDIMMYDYFNNSLWKKVNAYGRVKMEKDLRKLRAYRNDYLDQKKADSKPNSNRRKMRQAEDYLNHKVFERIRENLYQEATMMEILQKKIEREDRRLSKKQIAEIANHMIRNKGGCPM